jgi:hypothetical protein
MAKNNTTKYLLIGGAIYAAYYLLKKPKQINGSEYIIEQIEENFKSDMLEVTKQFYHFKKNQTFDSANVLNTKVKALSYWADELKKANK